MVEIRTYALKDFDALPKTAAIISPTAQTPSDIPIIELEELPPDVPPGTIELILCGDDVDNPIGTAGARFPSRSEVRWAVARSLAAVGLDAVEIAGMLLNPKHRISDSVLKSSSPKRTAFRDASRAIWTVETGWPDVTAKGHPRPTYNNAMIAIVRLGVGLSYDEFRNRLRVGGYPIQQYAGDLSDKACALLRKMVLDSFKFDPGKDNIRDAAEALALENPFHPIREYLGHLVWDGERRLHNLLHQYFQADDTELNAAIGSLMMVAAVRRTFKPGTKFDTAVILEGKQGTGKSTALKILAGDENCSDAPILHLDSKTQMELLEGVWIQELSELEGMGRAETTSLKGFLSRAVDQGRPAYGRFKETWPRQNIFVGTTNDTTYLLDDTGNRRFLPVKTGVVDLEGLARDRDQLWAEAVRLESEGYSIVLPKDLWGAAASEQESRMKEDPWQPIVEKLKGEVVDGEERLLTSLVLQENMDIPVGHQTQAHTKRLAGLLRAAGWEGPVRLRLRGVAGARGYRRPAKR